MTESKELPTVDQIKEARINSGLTQTNAGLVIHKSCRAWQQYEAGDRAMDLAYWELFLIKTNSQIKGYNAELTGRGPQNDNISI
jgi:hypothetical protein